MLQKKKAFVPCTQPANFVGCGYFNKAICGHEECVDALLNAGADPNARDIHGRTPIIYSAICDHIGILGTLIQSGGLAYNLDAKKYSALHWACYMGNESCTELLLEENSQTALNGNPFSPIHCAAIRGNEACLEVLIDALGNDVIKLVDSKGRTPLHAAAFNDHTDFIQLLIERGADVNAIDKHNQTPIMIASKHGNFNALDALMESKANVNLVDKDGNTVLHLSCMNNHQTCALHVLERIQDQYVSFPNSLGLTPLHIAARQGLSNVVCGLVDRGANMHTECKQGNLPILYCASDKNTRECLRIILSAMILSNDLSSMISRTSISRTDQEEINAD